MENKYKVLMHLGCFVDEIMLTKGVYATAVPKVRHPSTTMESIIADARRAADSIFVPEAYFENLLECELVNITICTER